MELDAVTYVYNNTINVSDFEIHFSDKVYEYNYEHSLESYYINFES
jgi:hypothetical protein